MTMSKQDVLERVKWNLLADATTDFFSLPEGIATGISLLGSGPAEQASEDLVVSVIGQLLDDGLIALYQQHSLERPGSDEEIRKLSTEEARTSLGARRWRFPEIEPDGISVWYTATPQGETAFLSLTPEDVTRFFSTRT
jgi:hypothetical protein